MDVAAELGNWETSVPLGLIRIAAAYASSRLNEDQWVGKIGVSRAASVATAAVKRESLTKGFVSTGLGEIETTLDAIFNENSRIVTSNFGVAMVVARAAKNNIRNAQLLSSQTWAPSQSGPSRVQTVLAPVNYSRDVGSQAALVNAVAQSVRGGSAVLVEQDRTQSMLLQHELNRQGVATRVADTPQAGLSLAKQAKATWVIGVDGHRSDPPDIQPPKVQLKPPESQRGWVGPPQPPPPAVASASSGPAYWAGFSRFTPPTSSNNPGGVRTFKDALIDNGQWPVHAPLTLCLPVIPMGGNSGSPEVR